MGSSFFFELPVYVNEASLKGGKYTLPGTVLSPEVVQTSNSMSYHRNRQAQYLESDSNSESSLLDTNNASSVLDGPPEPHALVHIPFKPEPVEFTL